MIRTVLFLIITLLSPAFSEQKVYGWLEYVKVGKGEYRMKAKLDSGAKTSSLHIMDLEFYESGDGKNMVKFKIKGTVPSGDQGVWKKVTMTKPIHRTVRIKSSNGEISTRVSVLLPMKIGNTSIETEFTLSNREDMNYPILLGRSSIANLGFIDCSKSFLVKDR